MRALDRASGAERSEVAFARERGFQQLVILPPRHLDGAEGPEVIGHVLGVEQLESADLEPGHEMHERDLGRVARAMEHALAEERPPERDPVEPADQRVALVDFEAVAMAALVELAIEHADARIDPRARPAVASLRATFQHAVEVAVDGDGEAVGTHRSGEPRGNMKAIERNDAAHLRLDPVEGRVLRAVRHGKDAAGIGLEQHFRRDLDEGGFAVGHAFAFEPAARMISKDKVC